VAPVKVEVPEPLMVTVLVPAVKVPEPVFAQLPAILML